ncbi:NIPSNAP family protein [Microterricola viridarii]|uniref:NIPSNAP protein n=1 Tax=Microterricola viridarii TaxID=412690 RepID=A0A1H1ZP77_9MICO|nr:NIPSNAP family protein [Microterricola viridarii]SDT35036.1 NIPSNAP protein [Microterricola viridarii]
MLIEQRTYDINPGTPMADFLREYSTRGLPAQKRILGGFLGYFVTEFGTQNQVNHFWAFADLEERRRRRAELAADPEWQDCIGVVRPMIIRWDNKIMYPTEFSPIRSLPVATDEPLTAFTFGAES